jgi:hypothetical protein
VRDAQRDLHGTQPRSPRRKRAGALQARRVELEAVAVDAARGAGALVRSAYALGRQQELQMLLEQDRIGDLARVLAYHRYFERARSERIGKPTASWRAGARRRGVEAAQGQLLRAAAASAAKRTPGGAERRSAPVVANLDARYRDRTRAWARSAATKEHRGAAGEAAQADGAARKRAPRSARRAASGRGAAGGAGAQRRHSDRADALPLWPATCSPAYPRHDARRPPEPGPADRRQRWRAVHAVRAAASPTPTG